MSKRGLFLAAVLGFVCAAPVSAFAHEVELTQEFTPKLVNGTGDLYVPLPQQSLSYQKVLSQSVTGNASSVKTERVPFGPGKQTSIGVLHAHWDKVAKPELKVAEKIELTDRETPKSATSSPAYFLKPSKHVETDGIVLKTAEKITKGIRDPDKKAQAIYEWIVDNTFRDANTRGCGLGDVKTLLLSGNLRGKCADLNSLFVGLARASGIPAREVWGLRVAPSAWQEILGKEGDVSKAQHCRAEYYSVNKRAWIPADPADIRKLVLDGKMRIQDPEVRRLRKTLFGKWEGNWVAFNFARDFRLPGQKETINYFMYPQLVSSNRAPDGVDPSEVSYVLTSRVIKQ